MSAVSDILLAPDVRPFAVAAAIIYLATGNEPWLWAAAPGCLGSSFLLFAIARLRKQLATP